MRKLDLKEYLRAVATLSREFPSATLVAVLMVFAIAGEGQQQKADEITASPYSLQVQSRLVVLDVVVTDRAGAIRDDLKAEDFHISEDGIVQKIVNFEIPSAHIIPAKNPIFSTADLDKRAPQSPVNIVVLDELNTTFQDMA